MQDSVQIENEATGESLLRPDSSGAVWGVWKYSAVKSVCSWRGIFKPQTCTTSSLLRNVYEKWQSSLHRHLEGTEEQSTDLCRLSNAYCHKEVLFEHQTANVHPYLSLTPRWRQSGFPDPNVVHVFGIGVFSVGTSVLWACQRMLHALFCPWKCPQAGKREKGCGMGVQMEYWRLCAQLLGPAEASVPDSVCLSFHWIKWDSNVCIIHRETSTWRQQQRAVLLLLQNIYITEKGHEWKWTMCIIQNLSAIKVKYVLFLWFVSSFI